jgi:hypothetical protein
MTVPAREYRFIDWLFSGVEFRADGESERLKHKKPSGIIHVEPHKNGHVHRFMTALR